MEASAPSNEAGRLAALRQYDVLDTAPEPALDDITALAAHICDVPIALVTFVDDDRQWFKSKVGLEFTQTPRAHSFCAHAILQPKDVMVVQDASLDNRFALNPVVTGDPNIRFYAGAPIVISTGEALGTVCVMDRVPRELDPAMIDALKALARQVVPQLELRRAVTQLKRLAMEQERSQRQLEGCQKRLEDLTLVMVQQSTIDALTGLKNRSAFERIMNEESSRTERSNSPLALVVLDVDDFGSFNEKFGYVHGDEALQQVSLVLQSHARTYDHVARYGGAEFAVILPDTGSDAAMVVAQRMRNAIQNFAWSHRPITVSVGVATTTTAQGSMDIVERADKALFLAKHKGNNCVVHLGEGG